MKTSMLLIALFSMGCASNPVYDQKFVTDITNGGGGIMVTKCFRTGLGCKQEFIQIGSVISGTIPAIQLNNNVK